MVIDFSEIKRIVNQLDHGDVNEHLRNPTAEHMAEYLVRTIPLCYKVDVEETKGSIATYEL